MYESNSGAVIKRSGAENVTGPDQGASRGRTPVGRGEALAAPTARTQALLFAASERWITVPEALSATKQPNIFRIMFISVPNIMHHHPQCPGDSLEAPEAAGRSGSLYVLHIEDILLLKKDMPIFKKTYLGDLRQN